MFVALLLVGLLSTSADEVDHLSLAAALLHDGHADRAARVLAQVDPAREDLDRPRFHTLSGLVAFEKADYVRSLTSFEAALAAGASDPALHVYRAQAAFRTDDCPRALTALAAAGPAGEAHAELFLLRAECHWRNADPEAALGALQTGAERFPGRSDLSRARIHRLLELGLYQTAVEVGNQDLGRGEATLDDHLFFAEALIRAGRHADARPVLESARLRFGDDPRLLAQLGHAWLGAGAPGTAAGFFERAAALDPQYTRDAAELYRRAGRLGRALRLNAEVTDPAAKLRQRLALLLDQQRYEAITALGPRLSRAGLLASDEQIRYALAYAWFRLGEHRRAEAHLKVLRDPALFERAAHLRRSMATCAQEPAACDE